jgi:YidC/Oxa1 family membrane protein insertase
MFVASIFDVLIVKPIFNLLVFIYAILPGHNFGLALIIFTVIIRLLLWPLVKKQLHQARAMRELQPEIKKIKAASKGNRQKESALLMELYKEKEISPFGSLGTLIIQFVILIGLYSGLRKVVANPAALVNYAYPFLRHLSWLKELGGNIHLFDATLLGFVNLTRSALGSKSGVYWPAMVIVIGSAIAQYYQSKQLLPSSKESRGIKQILKEANSGKKADQGEINAAVGQSTRYFIPVLIFLFTVNIASAISLYWFVGGVIAFLQQSYALRKDKGEMLAVADGPSGKSDRAVVKSEVVKVAPPNRPNKPKKSNSKNKRKKK